MRKVKKICLLMIMSILLASCNEAIPEQQECTLNYEADMAEYQRAIESGEITADSPAPIACEIPSTDPEAGLDVNLVMRDFTSVQEEKMLKAVERLKLAINSVEFKEKVLNHKVGEEFTFVDNAGLSNEEIYKKIMEGKEDLLPEIDYEMDVDVTMYYKSSSTVGYTYPDTTRTWVNSRFFNGYSLGEVAGNVSHEWTHKLGFEHSFSNNSKRPYSVPYAVGTIVREIVDQM